MKNQQASRAESETTNGRAKREIAVCLALLNVLFVLIALLARPAVAATFTVNDTDDGIDAVPGDGVCLIPNRHTCTLRAAIMEANALPGADAIILPAGRFMLRFPGVSEDDGLKGDLDITDDVSITGAGQG